MIKIVDLQEKKHKKGTYSLTRESQTNQALQLLAHGNQAARLAFYTAL